MSVNRKISKPHIAIAVMNDQENSSIVKEVIAGLEEENVPWEIKPLKDDNAIALAYKCAHESPLEVGVAVGKDGSVVIHVKRIQKETPLFYLTKDEGERKLWRLYGSNAARIVKGIPFKDITESEIEQDDEVESLIKQVTLIVMRMLKESGIEVRG